MFPPIVTPYLVGVVTAPLVVKILKPIVRGTVKASIGLATEAKKAAAEAALEYHYLAAEANADLVSKSGAAARSAADKK